MATINNTTMIDKFPYGLCFFDIDGTILKSDSTMSDRVKNAINECRKRGAGICIATGRPACLAAKVPKILNYQIDYLITGNGNNIFEVNGENASDWGIPVPPIEVLHEPLVQFCDEVAEKLPNAEFMVVKTHHISTPPTETMACCDVNTTPHAITKLQPGLLKVFQKIMKSHKHAYSCPDFANDNFNKAVVVMKDLNQEECVEKVKPILEASKVAGVDNWEIKCAGLSCAAEITPKGTDKAKMIHMLCEKLGKSNLDCISFGDGLNDVGMLKYCGLGISMKNAEGTTVTESANFETDTNDNDGVALILEEMIQSADSIRAYGEKKRGGN